MGKYTTSGYSLGNDTKRNAQPSASSNVKDLLDKGLEALNSTGSFEEMWGQANWQSLGLIPTIYGLVFLIFVIILGFKFMKRGIEVSLMIVGIYHLIF